MSAYAEYVDLHAHSTFSFLDGNNHPAEIAKRVAEIGRKAHALTDHGNVSSHPAWEQAAKKVGVKPIFGVEAYFTPDVQWQREKKERPTNTHLTVLAENQPGYQNLLRMVTESYQDGYYYRAWVDEPNIRRHSSGLIFLSGCLSSMMSRLLVAERLDDAVALARSWADMVGKDNYRLETQLFSHRDSLTVNAGILRVSKLTGIPVVTTNDVHMISGEEAERDNRRLLHCIRDGRAWDEDPGDFSYSTEYPLTLQEVRYQFEQAQIAEAYAEICANTMEIAERCNVELPKSSFIEFPLPAGADKVEYFASLVKEGAARRGIDLHDPVYGPRAEYEFRLIEEKGFIDYFLVTADMVAWAKDNGILVGPARGSAAGSLLCYLLRITEVDPLRWGLMFERFIDVTRSDLPDIDLDFDQERRGEIRKYFERKYGADRVGILGTFVEWKGRNSLDSVGKAFRVPVGTVAEVKDQIDDRAMTRGKLLEETFALMPKAREAVEKFPALRRAQMLEGQMKDWSTHACGLLLSSRPLTDLVAIYRKRDEQEDGVCSVDYDGASHLGLLKEDVLGVKMLTVIREVLDEIGMSFDEFYHLPVDDELTLEGFRRANVLGVFQFEGVTNRYLLERYPHVASVEDLSHITALARPGPRQSGVDYEFLYRRAGKKNGQPHPVPSVHPDVDRILAQTYGLMVYQEQLLQVGREVGGLSWDVCNELRKAMSKKRGTAEFENAEADFIRGAGERGLTAEAARSLWDSMVTFGAYAFNKSHSISYALVAYGSMYLKMHYPAHYYAAICRHENDAEMLRAYLLEFYRVGGQVLPVDVNKSGVKWRAETLADGTMALRAGLIDVPYLGERTAELIVEHGPYISEDQLASLRVLAPSGLNPKRTALVANKRVMEQLRSIGAFSSDDSRDFGGLREFVRVLGLCKITHKTADVTREFSGDHIRVAGRVKEVIRSSKREAAERLSLRANHNGADEEQRDWFNYKDPHLDSYYRIIIEDDFSYLPCVINRYRTGKFKRWLSSVKPGDIVMFEGSSQSPWRTLQVDEAWHMFSLQEDGSYIRVEND